MKIGVRKPSIKRSIKARTTGRVKRAVKKSINPLYGKKGVGLVTDPKKAAYNAIYNRTTVSAKDVIHDATSATKSTKTNQMYIDPANQAKRIFASTFTLILAIILLVMCLVVCLINPIIGGLGILLASWYIYKHFKCKKELKNKILL